jgi:1-acyl-sn-glycerol-3-phosphate acyltransferase
MTERADGSYSSAWRGLTKIFVPSLVNGLMGHEWSGLENIQDIPADRGVILAVNHLSYADVLAIAMFSYRGGRYPVFLTKSSLFEKKLFGTALRKLGQLPVYRGQADAALVLRDVERGLRDGAGVIFYPESTVTRDPDQWPMVAKTGAARAALATGTPVIPVAQWGAQRILPYGSFRPHLLPRTTVRVAAGPPVDLSAFEGRPLTAPLLREATEAIMRDITGLLAGLRGETPPARPFDPAAARRDGRRSDHAAGTNAPADSAGSASSADSAVTARSSEPGPEANAT